jgi:hypothetical protein
MKTRALLLALAAFVLAGCGGSGSEADKTDFERIEEASGFSEQASEQADLAIGALAEGDVETATEHVDEARELAVRAEETLAEVESEPTRVAFTRINDLTLEGYENLADGIEAAGRGDERATDRYIRESLAIRNRKLKLLNETDFESVGAGESNEKIRKALLEQLRPGVGG